MRGSHVKDVEEGGGQPSWFLHVNANLSEWKGQIKDMIHFELFLSGSTYMDHLLFMLSIAKSTKVTLYFIGPNMFL